MMEDGESIPAAIAREVLEETGYEVDIGELIALGSRPATNDVIVVVEGRIKGVRKVEIALSEIETADFFSYDKLPEPMKPEVKYLLELYRRGVRGQLLVIEPSGSD
jgi:ADP-ribose pyrophosphatase YjhB (NUDIX family)